ncbi:MAG TPA: TonB-dependent receptor [Bryobacteraceae bacterium]|nr:TonB-dependent receptor [Bryobacteraceae bacterium]
MVTRIDLPGCAFRTALSRPAALALCWLLILLSPIGSLADDPQQPDPSAAVNLKQLSLEQLGNVEITSVSKNPQQVMKTAAAIFVITQADIRRSGATSIPEALRLAPGVEVARIDADHWSVAIRGLAGQFSKDLLVLIDGRSVYTPLFAGVYWDVQNVMLEDVERIEVIRGPGGTIWGANAVNGVINIITASAEHTHGALVSLGGGNVEQGTGGIRYGGTMGKDFNYRVYGTGDVRAPEFHPDGNDFDRFRMGQAGFRTDWKKGDKDSFTVQGDIYTAGSGESSFLPTFSPAAEIMAYGNAIASGGNVLTRWQHTMGEGSDIQIQAYFDRTHRVDLEGGEARDTFDVDYVQHARIHGYHNLTWGLGARVSPSKFIQTTPGISFMPLKQTDSIYSGFFQYELPIVRDKLTLTAGSKLERNNFSGFEYEPSVRLLWTPTSNQTFWAAATRSVRTPSRQDQDVAFAILAVAEPTPPSVYFEVVGNPDAKAEQMIGYEAGYRAQVNSNLYLDIAAFYNRYSGLQAYGPPGIAESADPPPLHLFFVLPYANIVEGNTVGGEIAPDWKITHWWQMRGSYAYLNMALHDKPGFTDVGNLLGSYDGSSPRHVVSAQSFFNLPKHFEFDVTYRYSSALPAYGSTAYSSADARLGWHVGENVEFSVVGQNLLQPYHPEFGGNPGPLVGIKRSAFAKLTWRK